MRTSRLLLLAALTMGLRAPAADDEAVVEPVSIDEVLPSEAGETSVRTSLGASVESAERERPELLLVPEVQLFVGLTERLGAEASVAVSVAPRLATARVSLVSGSLKFALLKPAERSPGVAFRLEATLVGNEGEALAGSIGLVHSVWRFTLQGALGISGRFTQRSLAAELGVSLGFRATERLFLLGEAQGEWEFVGRRALCASVGPALKWALVPATFVALGALFGVGDERGQFRAVVQLQHRL